MRLIFGILIAALLSVANAIASDAPFFVSEDHPEFLILSGPIDGRSALAFSRVISKNGPFKVLILNSPGGNVQNALLIAQGVKKAGIDTYIGEDQECTSACAFIFMAGNVRIAQGKLGVHQIYGEDANGRDTQIYVADIIEFLSKFGVHNNFLVSMLRTPPESMYFFSDEEKETLQINRTEAFEVADKPGTEDKGNKPSPADRLVTEPLEEKLLSENEALQAVTWFIGLHESSGEADRLDEIIPAYADVVDYFNDPTTRANLSKDKQKYFNRWPHRKYSINTDELSVLCSVEKCRISGNYGYELNSPADDRTASGEAYFYFDVRSRPPYHIIGEGGKVLKNKREKKSKFIQFIDRIKPERVQ